MSGTRHEDDFGRRLRGALEGYRPDVPADEMWREIERARGRGHPGRRWVPAAAAAAVVGAFVLGRLTAPAPDRVAGGAAGPGAAAGPAAVADGPPLPGAWAVSAGDHFREAETLLVLFRSEDGDVQGRTARWARSLLGTTRLLMDSPAGADPRMAEALEDLELVLVQIANLGTGADTETRRFVEESLREHQVLTKIRAASEWTELPLSVED